MSIRHSSFRFTAPPSHQSRFNYPTRGLIQIHEAAEALSRRGFDVASPAALASALHAYVAEGGQVDELI